MYIVEFCYFGNAILAFYILFFGENRAVFSIAYVCNSGVMSLAVIAFNNQAQFSSTDHITSAYIHTLPLIASWAIRWKHMIYNIDELHKYGLNIMNFDDISYSNDPHFYSMIYIPILFWLAWGVFYYVITTTVLKKYVQDNKKYGSGVGDFVKMAPFKFIFGDHSRHSHLKYLLQHFAFFIAALPLTWLFFYNFYLNTLYIVFIIGFLGWNTARNDFKRLGKKLEKAGMEVSRKDERQSTEEKSSKNFN